MIKVMIEVWSRFLLGFGIRFIFCCYVDDI